MPDLKSEFLFDVTALLEPPQVVGTTARGTRQILYVKGGTVVGPKINGEVLPGGADWLLTRSDGVGELDVRISLRLETDQIVYMTYRGYIILPPEAFSGIVSGVEVDPATYYFRTNVVFETGSTHYGWLNNIVAVGVGRVAPYMSAVSYSIHHIL